MNTPAFTNAKRTQTSFLTPLEGRVMPWLCRHTPLWLKPDHFTALGLLAMFLTGLSYALAPHYPALLLLVNVWVVINWVADALDGAIARFRKIERPRYGFYVDHITDVFGACFVTMGLILSPYMSAIPAAALLATYLMLCIHTYLATYVTGEFKLSILKIGPSELRFVFMVVSTIVFFYPTILVGSKPVLLLDIAGAVVAIAITLVLIFSVIHRTIALYKMERV